MDIVRPYLGNGLYFLGVAILARRSKFTWKQTAGALSQYFFFGAVSLLGGQKAITVIGFVYVIVIARMYWLLGDRWKNEHIRNPNDKCSLGVFMGSGKLPFEGFDSQSEKVGGHTAEMKALVSSLDFERYTSRTYVYCHGDEMSIRTIAELESSSDPSVSLQSLYSVQ